MERKIPEKNSFILGDCMDYLPLFPDKYFDLAIVDPPYGINMSNYNRTESDKLGKRHKKKNWDRNIPDETYFQQLFRVSKNQIIWGGNYFPYLWRNGCRCFIYWYKGNPAPNYSDGELAWTSFDSVAKQFDYRYYGNIEGESIAEYRIHPTQKPVALYRWLLKNYAKKGDLILDTHAGSGSLIIACIELGFDYIAFEIDEEYYTKAKERIKYAFPEQTLFEE